MQFRVFEHNRLALAIIAAFSQGSMAFAADVSGDKELGEMVVRLSRPTVTADNPSPQAEVTAEQIRDINVINTEDVVKYLPSLNVRKRYIGDRNSVISARTSVGTTPSATSLVYADGLLLSNLLGNSYSYPPRWNLVGSEEIERVDVLYGPFSALLPGNSIGATVLITTRRPERTEAHARVQAFQEHYANYGTDKDYRGSQEQVEAGTRLGDLRISVLGNHLDAYGHPMQFATTTTKKNGAASAITGYSTDLDTTNTQRFVYAATSIDHSRQDTGKIRLDYDFSPSTRAAFTWAEFRNRSDLTSDSYLKDAAGNTILTNANVSLGGGKYFAVKASDFTQSRTETLNRLLGLTFNSRLSSDWSLEAAASDYSTPTDINRAPNNGMSASGGGVGTITYGDDTGWRNLDLKAIWKPQGGATGHTVTSGLHSDEYRYSSLKYNTADWLSDATTSLQTKSVGKTRTDALFAQDAWKFDPRWTLIAGLRHERWQAFDGAYFEKGKPLSSGSFSDRSGSFNSPKATLAWQATPDWQLRASLARAYRMPTVVELFGTSKDAAGNAVLADASLLPEKVLAKDLTAEGAVGGGILRISLFQEDKDNYILSQTNTVAPKITSFQNVGKTWVQGIETAFTGNDVLVRGLDLQASVTYADSKVKEDATHPEFVGRPLAIPHWRATAFAVYHLSDAWSGSVGIRHSSEFPQLDPAVVNQSTYGGSSRYTVADARVSYRFDKYVGASLGVDNIGNEKYYAYHPYPQRTIHAELRIDY